MNVWRHFQICFSLKQLPSDNGPVVSEGRGTNARMNYHVQLQPLLHLRSSRQSDGDSCNGRTIPAPVTSQNQSTLFQALPSLSSPSMRPASAPGSTQFQLWIQLLDSSHTNNVPMVWAGSFFLLTGQQPTEMSFLVRGVSALDPLFPTVASSSLEFRDWSEH